MISQTEDRASTWASIVFEAVKGKYPDTSIENVSDIVSSIIDELRSITIDNSVIEQSRCPIDLASDVRNQVLAFFIIENSESCSALKSQPLVFLQHCLKGPTGGSARTGLKVDDFGGEVPTPASEAGFRFDEMQRLVVTLASSSVDGYQAAQFRLLAHVFSGIIRIHYFDDGNGRTARMAVQYLSKRWKLPYVLIPKVRNDIEWKYALTKALEGDLAELEAEIISRQIG